MKEAERFINQATRWLWGKRKSEVREELEGHFYDRVSQLQSFGVEESEAVRRVVSELGGATSISSGMATLYNRHLLIGLSAILVATALYPLIHQKAVPALHITDNGPIPFCTVASNTLDSNCMIQEGQTWIETNRLPTLGQGMVWGFDNETHELQLKLPGGDLIAIPQSFSRDGHSMVETEEFLGILAGSSKIPIKLWGIKQPTLLIGESFDDGAVMLSLGDSSKPVDARRFYARFLEKNFITPKLGVIDYVISDQPNVYFSQNRPWKYKYEITTSAPPGTVFAIISGHLAGSAETGRPQYLDGLSIDIVESNLDRTVEFRLDMPKVQFVENLGPIREELYSAHLSSKKTALMVQFTGRIDSGGRNFLTPLPTKVSLVATNPE